MNFGEDDKYMGVVTRWWCLEVVTEQRGLGPGRCWHLVQDAFGMPDACMQPIWSRSLRGRVLEPRYVAQIKTLPPATWPIGTPIGAGAATLTTSALKRAVRPS